MTPGSSPKASGSDNPIRRDLEGNFIDLLRGKLQLACNADLGCACLPKLRRRQATMVAIKMAVESFRQSKTRLRDLKVEKVRTV